MVFPVVGGDGKPTGYEIENSLRINDDDSAKLSRTFDSGGNRRTFTFSAWVKRGNLGQGYADLFGSANDTGDSSGQKSLSIGFTDGNKFTIDSDTGSALSLSTNALFRDVSAWYHFVVAVDTTQSTESNRVKLYVNGTQETLSGNYPSQNLDTAIGRADAHTIGADYNSFFDGYMADVYYINGQQYDQTYFGETNNNGVWVPVENGKGAGGTITFGTNGFFMQFQQTGTSQNSSGMGADTSGNDNHFAVTNLAATDITVDTPTNNFATMNPLSPTQGTPAYAEGNLKISADGSVAYSYFPSTFGLSNGKWYAEVKVNSQGGNTFIGIAETSMEAYYTGAGNDPHLTAGTIWYANGGNGYYDGSSQDASTFGAASFTSGDIIGLALDLDSGTRTIKFYKNGSLTATKNLTSNFVDPIVFAANLFNTQNQSWNFGNPDFSISSGNADANGYGNFEYAPPSGYYACCTKNLAEYG